MTPTQLRNKIRKKQFNLPTAGLCLGFVQVNVAMLPQIYADDFEEFCLKNPIPCPLVARLESGCYKLPNKIAKDSDIRTDLSKYRIFKDGIAQKNQPDNIIDLWQDDLTVFLIGCSFTFENALISSSLEIRHISSRSNVPMYLSNIDCVSVGVFKGKTVVSMRPFKKSVVDKVVEITSHYPKMHGKPIHVGSPKDIGIQSIDHPDFGDAVKIHQGEVPLFWGCGVTPQLVLKQAKLPFAITHSPGFMYVTDLKESSYYQQ